MLIGYSKMIERFAAAGGAQGSWDIASMKYIVVNNKDYARFLDHDLDVLEMERAKCSFFSNE
jgi:hypothetical protein